MLQIVHTLRLGFVCALFSRCQIVSGNVWRSPHWAKGLEGFPGTPLACAAVCCIKKSHHFYQSLKRSSPFDAAADSLAWHQRSCPRPQKAGNIQQPNSLFVFVGPWGFETENSGSRAINTVPCCTQQEPEVALPAGVTAGQAMISEWISNGEGMGMDTHDPTHWATCGNLWHS